MRGMTVSIGGGGGGGGGGGEVCTRMCMWELVWLCACVCGVVFVWWEVCGGWVLWGGGGGICAGG
jgi:hypothetical protein